jgi:hypothetical protein
VYEVVSGVDPARFFLGGAGQSPPIKKKNFRTAMAHPPTREQLYREKKFPDKYVLNACD